MASNKEWMYASDRIQHGRVTKKWLNKMEQFIEFAMAHPECVRDGKIKCPCAHKKCMNTQYLDADIVKLHLAKKGFMYGYHVWNFHGETESYDGESSTRSVDTVYVEHTNNLERMIVEAIIPNPEQMKNEVVVNEVVVNEDMEERPNPEAERFYNLIESARKKLWNGNHSVLSICVELMSIKNDYKASQRLIDRICKTYHDICPDNNNLPKDFNSAKKVIHGLGLPVEIIHSCINHCMIYWGEDSELDRCKFCTEPRYKPIVEGSKRRKANIPRCKMHYFPLIPRLQRLYASVATSNQMRWHAEHKMEAGKMCHPSDSKAWKYFDEVFPDFASEVRNVRLGLWTDDFQPFLSSGRQYSCWPVIVTPYNLPPGMCMKDEFFFLTILVPGPKNPKGKIDVYLQPLISELQKLWDEGVVTYDVSKKKNFNMKAALLWTISDFPAYEMLSGWSTTGRLACPYCMEDSDAFTLCCSRKQSWFDNSRKFLPQGHKFRSDKKSFTKGHSVFKKAPQIKTGEETLAELDRLGLKKVTEVGAESINGSIAMTCGWNKRSIFWDLPYWRKLLIRHNLDVMHIGKNVFDNIFYTVLNVKDKTKDNDTSRRELTEYCDRFELAYDEREKSYPKASYVLDKDSQQILCGWLKDLKFPDGYTSNLGRCVDMTSGRAFGMKSHYCHVFMQRLMPIAFRHLLPPSVWEAVTELSLHFKELTSTSLDQVRLQRMQEEIAIILCRLEKIFPPSLFDSMEHLPIHLSYEATLAGPVQYRWMYPFERYLGKLKAKISNSLYVEGSICNGYLLEEITKFCSFYFVDGEPLYPYKLGRNDMNVDDVDDDPERLLVFKTSGSPIGEGGTKELSTEEWVAAHTYVLLNSPELEPYFKIYREQLCEEDPLIDEDTITEKMESEFRTWFKSYSTEETISNQFIRSLAHGPLRVATSYQGYFVNGFRFHTRSHGHGRSSMNSGVCISGSTSGDSQYDYYGMLDEIVELEYPALPVKKVTMFKCEWFDPTNKGTVVHPRYKMVDVDHTRHVSKDEPFALAYQMGQVYYCSYPSKQKGTNKWWAVCKIKARSALDMPEYSVDETVVELLQEDVSDENNQILISIDDDDGPIELVDSSDATGYIVHNVEDEPQQDNDELCMSTEDETEDDMDEADLD